MIQPPSGLVPQNPAPAAPSQLKGSSVVKWLLIFGVLAIFGIGVLAALAIFGVKKYIAQSRLQEGAEKANKICMALRAKNIDAYEFHDRHESVVTVGSFDWISQQGIDGRDVLNPTMVSIMAS